MRYVRVAGLAGLAISACLVALQAAGQTAPAPPAPAAMPSAAPPPPTPKPFQDALLAAANDLFSKANIPAGFRGPLTLVIDPLIDGVTGAQSVATQTMERRIRELVSTSYPRFQVKPFSTAEVSKAPIVLIGTFTPINNAAVAGGPKDVFRICLALADFSSRKIISKGVARSSLENIDATPTAYFTESPVFSKDPATDSYIKSCQGTRPGDPIDQVYADRILGAALIADAVLAYDTHHYKQALDLYRSASRTPGGDQLRTLNGLYLATSRLHQRAAATEAFASLVDYGMKNDRLAVKFLFNAGSTQFSGERRSSSPYSMWLREIASHAEKGTSCLEIVGHTSPTGPAPLNDRLSALRAEYVKDRLSSAAPDLTRRMIATGVGSKQNLIGTGKDDASDALDRRVEFKIIPTCTKPQTAT